MNNWDLERLIFKDFPLKYDNITAEAAERAYEQDPNKDAWDRVIEEILILAKETIDE